MFWIKKKQLGESDYQIEDTDSWILKFRKKMRHFLVEPEIKREGPTLIPAWHTRANREGIFVARLVELGLVGALVAGSYLHGKETLSKAYDSLKSPSFPTRYSAQPNFTESEENQESFEIATKAFWDDFVMNSTAEASNNERVENNLPIVEETDTGDRRIYANLDKISDIQRIEINGTGLVEDLNLTKRQNLDHDYSKVIKASDLENNGAVKGANGEWSLRSFYEDGKINYLALTSDDKVKHRLQAYQNGKKIDVGDNCFTDNNGRIKLSPQFVKEVQSGGVELRLIKSIQGEDVASVKANLNSYDIPEENSLEDQLGYEQSLEKSSGMHNAYSKTMYNQTGNSLEKSLGKIGRGIVKDRTNYSRIDSNGKEDTLRSYVEKSSENNQNTSTLVSKFNSKYTGDNFWSKFDEIASNEWISAKEGAKYMSEISGMNMSKTTFQKYRKERTHSS